MTQQIPELKLLHKYKNGNYFVELYEDGTKVRFTEEDEFIPAFSENTDVKITDFCKGTNCSWCHEGSSEEGKHGRWDYKFFETLHVGTEMAIGGGNTLSFPELVPFLTSMKEKGIICNITVNQFHFMEEDGLIDYLVEKKLIKGLGVSFMNYNDNFLQKIKKYENSVIHVINGIVNLHQLRKLYNNDLKLLILGYKELRRGATYYGELVDKGKKEIYDNIHEILRGFKVVSFDNLGIEQLNVKRFMLKENFDSFYMGNDGTSTFYIDLVKGEFASSSTSLKRYKLLDSIDEMFKVVRNETMN